MSDSSQPAPASELPPEERLDSWKEIAQYMRRDVTTVQRWEKREGMPVHRHLHDRLGSVYAFRSELDAWSHRRRPAPFEPSPTPPPDTEGGTPAPPSVSAPVPEIVTPGTAAPPAPATAAVPSRRAARWWSLAVILVLAGAAGVVWRIESSDRNPLANATFQALTDFGGVAQAAAISRDGRMAAFLSDRDGRMDLWFTRIGTGQFVNLTADARRLMVNRSLRTVAFSPDGELVTFWMGPPMGAKAPIDVWAVPVSRGPAWRYLEGAAEYDWSRDGEYLVYHTPANGDPTFVRHVTEASPGRRIFAVAAGYHSHFTTWAPDRSHIYVVRGLPEDPGPPRMDIWRFRADGTGPEQLTQHNALVSYPVFLDDGTLLYLAADPDGSGPRIHALDVKSRTSRRLSTGIEAYTSLAASADGTRLVATQARQTATLWTLPITSPAVAPEGARRVALTTTNGSSPRLGSGDLLYVSTKGSSDIIWKMQGTTTTPLWTAPESRIVGGPAVTRDGRRMAFCVLRHGRRYLYAANTDGTGARVVTTSFEPEGDPAWTPDGQAITVASLANREPRLFTVVVDAGTVTPFVDEYSVDPVWSDDGRFVVFSGADVGTTFPLKAVDAHGGPHVLPELRLTRGARRLVFLPGTHVLLLLRGEIRRKEIWSIDLDSGAMRQRTNFGRNSDISDFDVSRDGTELVIEQGQDQSEIVLIEIPRR